MAKITTQWLEEFKITFLYDKESGHITFRRPYRENAIGSRADRKKVIGWRNGVCRGYKYVVNFKNIRINSHRAAFLLVEGELPTDNIDIDHNDRNTMNNAWSNLRKATKSQNMYNAGIRSDNTTGIKGIAVTPSGTYYTCFQAEGVRHYVGTFATKELAFEKLQIAREAVHGDFARHN